MKMTKEKALELISNAESNCFDVYVYKTKTCELCNEPTGWDFKITSARLAHSIDIPKRLITNNNSHITKHICKECFIKIFDKEASNV